jgi:hypothetical protein
MCKAVVTISTIKGYANGAYAVGWDLNQFTEVLQTIEETKFGDYSISWLVTSGKAVYKKEWGAPNGGEDVFILETDYTEYDYNNHLDIDNWKHRVLEHAEYLRIYFDQKTVRVSFINNVETKILR